MIRLFWEYRDVVSSLLLTAAILFLAKVVLGTTLVFAKLALPIALLVVVGKVYFKFGKVWCTISAVLLAVGTYFVWPWIILALDKIGDWLWFLLLVGAGYVSYKLVSKVPFLRRRDVC